MDGHEVAMILGLAVGFALLLARHADSAE